MNRRLYEDPDSDPFKDPHEVEEGASFSQHYR
jgi:hypothetical protein